jgi:hypothetical protein
MSSPSTRVVPDKFGTEEAALGVGTLVRVGPEQRRKILPGPEGIVIVAIGAAPGKAYTPH